MRLFNLFKKPSDEKIEFNQEYFAFLTLDQYGQIKFSKDNLYILQSKTLQQVTLYKKQTTCEDAAASEGVIVKILVAEKPAKNDEKENVEAPSNRRTNKKPIQHHAIDSTIWVCSKDSSTNNSVNNVGADFHKFNETTMADFALVSAKAVRDELGYRVAF